MWDDVEMFHIDTFLPLIFSHLCGKMDKIRYRLVYNRQNTLNRQGTALVQVEAYLNQRKIYLKTNVYLKPECWSREGAQVINHPQSNELNAMLYEYILYRFLLFFIFFPASRYPGYSLRWCGRPKNSPPWRC